MSFKAILAPFLASSLFMGCSTQEPIPDDTKADPAGTTITISREQVRKLAQREIPSPKISEEKPWSKLERLLEALNQTTFSEGDVPPKTLEEFVAKLGEVYSEEAYTRRWEAVVKEREKLIEAGVEIPDSIEKSFREGIIDNIDNRSFSRTYK